MTTPSLQEAERIADKLLKAVEIGRPLLKDIQNALRDMQTAVNKYKALEISVEQALERITDMLNEARETYQLVFKLEENSNNKLTLIAQNAKTVHEELANLAKDREMLEIRYGTKRDAMPDIKPWRFME